MAHYTDKIMSYLNKTPEGQWFCNVCGYNEKYKSHVQRHVESKHYSPWYACKANCGKTFKLKNSCFRHEKTHCILKSI